MKTSLNIRLEKNAISKIKEGKGFSLIEVLIFTTILSLFFTMAIAVIIASLRDMKSNEHKIIATRYAEELLEWVRGEKDIDWNDFATTKAGGNTTTSGSSITYCFNNETIAWPTSTGECNADQLIQNIYKRDLTLSNIDCGSNLICKTNVRITVSWQDLGNKYTVPINTIFSIWE
jgi:type II secretory pathway pseudopilin PulG